MKLHSDVRDSRLRKEARGEDPPRRPTHTSTLDAVSIHVIEGAVGTFALNHSTHHRSSVPPTPSHSSSASSMLIFTSCSYTDSNHGPHYVHIRTCMRAVSRTFLLRSIACSLFSSHSISLYHRSSSIPSSRYIPGSFSLSSIVLSFIAPWSKSHAFPHVCFMLTLYLAHALRAPVC